MVATRNRLARSPSRSILLLLLPPPTADKADGEVDEGRLEQKINCFK